MKNIKVVIGANFGDEGKGLLTDYFAGIYKNGPGKGIVVRFNGGAQAGHTVTARDGSRHVFGHFCSGSFAGLPGYLSKFFVVNPMLFLKELVQLENEFPDINTKLYVDRNCMVTTPYDMMINQIAEISRGIGKHGSCGVGFNETITRNIFDEAYRLCIIDLKDPEVTRQKLETIRNDYIGIRLQQLGVDSVPKTYKDLLANDGIIEGFAADAADMLRQIEITDIGVLSGFDNIIFEGAQGLLLDQFHEYFPHVTRSNTGIKNAADLINKAGFAGRRGVRAGARGKSADTETGMVEVIYVTRAYMTRHGAGPFPSELPEKPYQGIVDMTNVPNPYQDVLRYGLMDIDALDRAISYDLEKAEGLECDVRLAVTCLDQLDEYVDFIIGQEHRRAPVEEYLETVFGRLKMNRGYLSYGPTRETISLWEKKD